MHDLLTPSRTFLFSEMSAAVIDGCEKRDLELQSSKFKVDMIQFSKLQKHNGKIKVLLPALNDS